MMANLWYACYRLHAEPSLREYELSPQLSSTAYAHAPPASQLFFGVSAAHARGTCMRHVHMCGVMPTYTGVVHGAGACGGGCAHIALWMCALSAPGNKKVSHLYPSTPERIQLSQDRAWEDLK